MKREVYVVGPYCFLKHPRAVGQGYWARTDRCVAFVECPYCKAKPGELCFGKQGAMVGTHSKRRTLYTQRRSTGVDAKRQQVTYVIIEESGVFKEDDDGPVR